MSRIPAQCGIARRKFGRLGFDVTEMGFGAAPIGNFMRPIAEAEVQETLIAAWKAGIRVFDTAPLYGSGLSEHRIGGFLRQFPRDDYVISTKVGYVLRRGTPSMAVWENGAPFRAEYEYTYDGIMRSMEDSLQRLGTDRVDIALLHDVDVVNHGAEAQAHHFEIAMTEGWRALEKLKDNGVVRAIGIGVNEWVVCKNALERRDFDCVLPAGEYSLLRQQCLEPLLDMCVERGVAVIAGGGYNGGILATGAVEGAKFDYKPAPPEIVERVRRIEELCAAHSVSLPAAATQFILAHPAVATLVHGVRNRSQLTSNMQALEAPIPAAFWADLKAVGLISGAAPTPADASE